MNIDTSAPVITRDAIHIVAPLDVVWKLQTHVSAWPNWRPTVPSARFDGELAVGSVFHWEEGGLQIASTVKELAPGRRIVWTGSARGIDAVHVWELTQVTGAIRVHTEESWAGETARAMAATLQPILDAALREWLKRLKDTAEETAASMLNR